MILSGQSSLATFSTAFASDSICETNLLWLPIITSSCCEERKKHSNGFQLH
ncbi:hypothetical protein Leryth_022553 [Lithospermum erythrorhizon]|nr:hypothetical protein Leryth_022553 [Lithospermum erythrorhizon]